MSAFDTGPLLPRAEALIAPAVDRAFTRWLTQARQAVLGTGMTADATPADLPPNLDAWPHTSLWQELLTQFIAPAIGVAFDMAFDAAARSDALQRHRYRQTFMDEVYDRLSLGLWTTETFERIRGDLSEGLDAGESVAQLRARISDQLDVDRNSYLADRIARTEAHTSVEGGSWSSMRAYADLTGETFYQQWIATADERTRPSHLRASGQRVPLDEAFTVGGEPLMFPGDPGGPAHETIFCRCSTLTGTQEELEDLPPSAADLQGSAMTAPTHTTTDPAQSDVTGEHATVTVETTDPPETNDALPAHWEGVLAPLDVRGDFRILASPDNGEVLTADHMWLSWQEKSADGHDGKVAVGTIDQVWVQDGLLRGRGRFDLEDETGTAPMVARKVRDGFAGTVSVDQNDLIDATIDFGYYDRDDQPVNTDNMDYEDLEVALDAGDLRVLARISNWRLAGATLVQDPAFHTSREGKESAFIEAAPAPEDTGEVDLAASAAPAPIRDPQEPPMAAVTAAAGVAPETATWAEQVAERVPMEPSAEWFTNPHLSGPTKVRVTDSGRVYGHVACWGTGHISFPGQDVRPPQSRTDYAHYRRNRIRCSDGQVVFAGTIVMGTGHADLYASPSAAMTHYDDTGHNVADVVVGEDAHGIWFSGALKPGVSPLQVLTLDRYSLSGDWRNEELVGVCVVNVPGFPISDAEASMSLAACGARLDAPRPRVRTHGADQCALVASGVLTLTRTRSTEEAVSSMVRSVEAWVRAMDQRMATLADDVYATARRGVREENEMARLAREIDAPAVEDARAQIEGL